ncbi:uncharacterized protein [Drosophila kikkawai]|uniref:Reverse transcriptase domain-containing protein n=1 Tax=Drosophila kikkawai TaxID=30033 RepID=A0ABM4GCM1_DROKI
MLWNILGSAFLRRRLPWIFRIGVDQLESSAGGVISSSPKFWPVSSSESEATMETLLTKFWEVEDLPCRLVKETDKLCEDFFVRTTTRSCDGKYIVSLPFKDSEHIDLGHSRSSALAQFLRNETRLKKEPALKDTYDSVIQEYIDLGHMKPVPPNTDKINFYLPHHAVFKPESATTKVRVVFNASSPSSNGNSLNDILYLGPVLQSDLTLQILKWRTFKFVFNADITKMYRQILLNQEHTPFQRILFRNGQGDISDFELQTVTFGVNCAPFLALRTLQQLSDDVNAQYPRTSHIISNYMYVDDVLAGAHTEAEAILAIRELQAALDSAGFPLRKWTSNERALLKALPKEHLLSTDFLDLEEVSTTKTLGERWNATTDEFYFVPTEVTIQANYSKCDVLSQIAKLFDPAGWLSPFVVQAKILMQDIWLASVEWDEFLPAELLHRWHDFLRSYSFLHQVRIPRWVHFQPGVQVQIHGFCDASQKAYGAAIYVRIQRDGIISSNLLTSKTKVAPVKTVSLPRLELCGAVLLSDLWTAILPQIPFGPCPEQDMLERFSKLDKALRVFAYVQRFIQRSQKRPIPGELQLSNTEISTAERLLIIITQRRYFALEYACLSQKRPIPASSSIKNMNPFLDPHGLIRACGRRRRNGEQTYTRYKFLPLPSLPRSPPQRRAPHTAAYAGAAAVFTPFASVDAALSSRSSFCSLRFDLTSPRFDLSTAFVGLSTNRGIRHAGSSDRAFTGHIASATQREPPPDRSGAD